MGGSTSKTKVQTRETTDRKPKSTAVAAILLAAGRSERMGAFKPLLPFGPQTVIKASIQFLREGGADLVIVVVGVGERAEELKEHVRDSGVIIAVNPDPASEMSASIACGARQLLEGLKAVLITPADHPAVPAEVVEQLISAWRSGARLVVPTSKGRGGHPVLVDLTFRNDLLTLDPERGLKALFDSHRDDVSRVEVNSIFIARDMDTWDDYAVLHQEVFGVLPPEAPSCKQT